MQRRALCRALAELTPARSVAVAVTVAGGLKSDSACTGAKQGPDIYIELKSPPRR